MMRKKELLRQNSRLCGWQNMSVNLTTHAAGIRKAVMDKERAETSWKKWLEEIP